MPDNDNCRSEISEQKWVGLVCSAACVGELAYTCSIYMINCTKKMKKKGHKQEIKRFLTKSKGCRDENAMSLVRNVNEQEGNMEW